MFVADSFTSMQDTGLNQHPFCIYISLLLIAQIRTYFKVGSYIRNSIWYGKKITQIVQAYFSFF